MVDTSVLMLRTGEDDAGGAVYAEVSEANPVPFYLVTPSRGVEETLPFSPIGIVTGAAYADKDAMGTKPTPVLVPKGGKLTGARYADLDDEGLRVDLWVFNRKPSTVQTDNGAFVVADVDLPACIAVIPFADFSDANTGQVSIQTGLDVDLAASNGKLWCWAQARGALNIAAGAEPVFVLVIRPDAGA